MLIKKYKLGMLCGKRDCFVTKNIISSEKRVRRGSSFHLMAYSLVGPLMQQSSFVFMNGDWYGRTLIEVLAE